MTNWRWIRLDLVHAVHDRQIAEHGGLDGVRDAGAIDSALAHPRNLAAYGDPDAAALAAAYACALLRNHGFADGNKRTAWVVLRVFLADHGYSLRCVPIDAIRCMESAAAGTVNEDALAAWIRARLNVSRKSE